MRTRGYTMLGILTWEGLKLILRRKLDPEQGQAGRRRQPCCSC